MRTGAFLGLIGKDFFLSAVRSRIDSNSGPNSRSPAKGKPHNLFFEAASPGQVLSHKALLAELVKDADLAVMRIDSAEASAMYDTAAKRVLKESKISCFGESAEMCHFNWPNQCSRFLATQVDAIAGLRLFITDCQFLLSSSSILLSIGSFSKPMSSKAKSVNFET